MAGIIGGALKGKAKALILLLTDANRSTEPTDTIEEIREAALSASSSATRFSTTSAAATEYDVIAVLKDIAQRMAMAVHCIDGQPSPSLPS